MDMDQIQQLMHRKHDAHKGQSGHVLIIGGSEDYVGATALAGIAALRSGCDLVTIAAPEKVAWAVNALSPDIMTKKLKGTYLVPKHIKALLLETSEIANRNLPALARSKMAISESAQEHAPRAAVLDKYTVIALGNGIGLRWGTKRFCKKLMRATKNKLKVIDADAIKLLSLQEIQNAIITPHARELDILLENSSLVKINQIKNKEEKAHTLQKHVGNNVLLLKGPIDYIISKDEIKKISGGNPGMAKAGTGDVLAGLCAGFLAQTHDRFKSAEAASTINKQIGDSLSKKRGYSFIASDMLGEIKKFKNK